MTIGNRVFVGPQVGIYAAGHPVDPELRGKGWEDAGPISIGDDVWIGGGTVLLAGVRIGSGTVVGAGSVVTRDLPSGVVAAGNPCRVLRTVGARDRESWLKRLEAVSPEEGSVGR